MLAIALPFNLLLFFPSFTIAGVIEGIVVKIADGDTITVLDWADPNPDSWTFLKL